MNSNIAFTYSVVIRTLGTGGQKYKKLLDSIKRQSCQPVHLYVIIAEGYELPHERVGIEEFIYTKKGMWHQRVYGLEYAANQRDADFILAVDDDISFADDFVENSIMWMKFNNCDVLTPDIIDSLSENNGCVPILSLRNIYLTLLGVRIENPFQKERVKIIGTSGYMANSRLMADAVPTQSAQFAALFIRTDKISVLDLKSEYWLEGTKYALPDDQVFYYKCHVLGLKVFMHEKYMIYHHDHGSSSPNRFNDSSFANGRNFLIFWHRFLYKRASFLKKIWLIFCIFYRILMHIFYHIVRGIVALNFSSLKSYYNGVRNGLAVIKSLDYKALPRIK